MWAMRAYVLARKGVLVNSPDARSMSDVQWAFEYAAMKKKEKDTFELAYEATRTLLVSILGLNALRPENDNGVPKKYDEMTDDEKQSFLPLIAWVGHTELLKAVQKQYDTEKNSISMDPGEYERLIEQIDAADGDMEPILGIPKSEPKPVPSGKIVDPMYDHTVSQLVEEYPDESKPKESVVDIEGDI